MRVNTRYITPPEVHPHQITVLVLTEWEDITMWELPFCVWQSVLPKTRLACVVQVFITSWAHLFILFLGKERAGMAVPWGVQMQSKKVSVAYVLTEPPHKAWKWTYLDRFYIFSPTSGSLNPQNACKQTYLDRFYIFIPTWGSLNPHNACKKWTNMDRFYIFSPTWGSL